MSITLPFMVNGSARIYMPNGDTNERNNVIFLNDTVGYFTNKATTVVNKTVDGGLTWSAKTLDLSSSQVQRGRGILGLYVFGYDSLLLIMNDKLIRTIDAGNNILDIPIDSSNTESRLEIDCYAFDRFAYRTEDQKGYYYTIDGTTWDKNSSNNVSLSGLSNYELPGHIFADGSFYLGENFYPSPNMPKVANRSVHGFTDFHFINDNIGIGGMNREYKYQKPKKQLFEVYEYKASKETLGINLYYTKNGGRSWKRILESEVYDPNEKGKGYTFSWDCNTVLHTIERPDYNGTTYLYSRYEFHVSEYPFTKFDNFFNSTFSIGGRFAITNFKMEAVKTNPLVSHTLKDESDRVYTKYVCYNRNSLTSLDISNLSSDSVFIRLASPPQNIIDVYCKPSHSKEQIKVASKKSINFNNSTLKVGRNLLGEYGYFIVKSGTSRSITEYDTRSVSISTKKLELYNNVKPNPLNPLNLMLPGKKLRFKALLKNNDKTILTSKAILRTDNPYVTITDSIANINNFQKGQEIFTGDEFEILLSPDIPKTYVLRFTISLDDRFDKNFVSHTTAYLPIVTEGFSIYDVLVDDDGNPDSQGDGDGLIEPNETIELLPLILNSNTFSRNSYLPQSLTLTTVPKKVNIWPESEKQEVNISGSIYVDSLSENAYVSKEDFVIDYQYLQAYKFEIGFLLKTKFVNFLSSNHLALNQKFLYNQYRGDYRHVNIIASNGSTLDLAAFDNSISIDLHFYESIMVNKTFNFIGTATNTNRLDKNDLETLSVYPNPNNGTFYLENLPNNIAATITIYNLNGVEVLIKDVSSNKEKILISDIKPGIYYLSVNSTNYNKVKKLIIR